MGGSMEPPPASYNTVMSIQSLKNLNKIAVAVHVVLFVYVYLNSKRTLAYRLFLDGVFYAPTSSSTSIYAPAGLSPVCNLAPSNQFSPGDGLDLSVTSYPERTSVELVVNTMVLGFFALSAVFQSMVWLYPSVPTWVVGYGKAVTSDGTQKYLARKHLYNEMFDTDTPGKWDVHAYMTINFLR